jgi:hypothetical protein
MLILVDADKYQGHQYTWMGFDEVTNWPSPFPINKLRACLRSADIPPSCLRFLLSGNPGGPGHNWVKAKYIDPARPFEIITEYDAELDQSVSRIFIPSLYKDNPALSANDPGYLSRLKDAGPEWLVKAWIEGDWNIVAGGMFDDVLDMRTPHEHRGLSWGTGNICDPFVIPSSWRVDRSFDWGSTAPFHGGWYAESDGTAARAKNGCEIHVPRGTVFLIHEWYGCSGEPNVGLKMLARDVATGILAIEETLMRSDNILGNHYLVRPGPADSSIYNAENGVCIGDDMAAKKVKWTAADKRPGSRKSGWEAMRRAISNGAMPVMEEPGFIAFSTCRDFWRTIPVAPRSKKDFDDLDTATEDHVADSVRYRLMNVVREVKIKKLKGL